MMRTHSICVALASVLLCPFASAQWVQMGLSDRGIREIAIGTSRMLAVTADSGCVLRSTDGGVNWFQIVDSLGIHIAVAPNGTTFMVMADSLFRSTDGGTSWSNLRMLEQLDVGTNRLNIYCVAVGPDGNVFSGCYARHVGEENGFGPVSAMSTDNGTMWNLAVLWGGEAFSFREHSVITSGFWTAPGSGWIGISVSFDDGLTWRSSPLGIRPPFVWCSNGTILCRATEGGPWLGGGGLWLSADMGATLTRVSVLSPSALLALPHGGVLVGTDTSGIYLFSDNGDSIKTLNDSLTDLHVHALVMDNSGYVYAGTNNGVWRRPLSQIVSVNQSREFPTGFRVEQNYPNPFNPSTTIRYELPRTANVTLRVYDVLGCEVSVLVNQVRQAGVYEVTFDGSGLASGMYLYRFQAGDVVLTREMLVVK